VSRLDEVRSEVAAYEQRSDDSSPAYLAAVEELEALERAEPAPDFPSGPSSDPERWQTELAEVAAGRRPHEQLDRILGEINAASAEAGLAAEAADPSRPVSTARPAGELLQAMQDLAADPGASDADRARVLAEYNAFVELAGRGSEPLAADVSEEVRDARNLLQEMSRAVTAHTEGRSVDPAQVAGFVQRVDELAAQGIPREGLAPARVAELQQEAAGLLAEQSQRGVDPASVFMAKVNARVAELEEQAGGRPVVDQDLGAPTLGALETVEPIAAGFPGQTT